MKRQVQIVISNQPSLEGDFRIVRVSGFRRIKLFLAGLSFAGVIAAVLTIILVVGSMLAAITWIILVIAVAGIILKATFRLASPIGPPGAASQRAGVEGRSILDWN